MRRLRGAEGIMTFRTLSATGAIGIIYLLGSFSYCTAGQAQLSSTIKTNFTSDALLAPEELNQVLALAKECGITNPAEVRTFHYLPAGGIGISVQSADRIEGRNTYFDTLTIRKSGWTEKPTRIAKSVGEFWQQGEKSTTHLRSYPFKGDTIRLSIGEGIDLAFADQVMSLLAEKKLRFKSESVRHDFEALGEFKPGSIGSDGDKQYRIFLAGLRYVVFTVENGEVLVSQVGQMMI
jgi:hypothetical protein